MHNIENYFLCSNTSKGFIQYYGELRNVKSDGNIFYIKGGPGTGKSTFMRKIAKHASSLGYKTEAVICSSDISSLDGVKIPDLNLTIADATAPHTIDPKYPGCVENILNFGEFWDKDKILPFKNSIISITDSISSEYKKIYRYLNAAGNIHSDSVSCVLPFCDFEKIKKSASNYVKKDMPAINKTSEISHRFLSAISYDGFFNTFADINKFYQNINVIDDKYGIGGIFLAHIALLAEKSGYDAVICHNPIAPDTIEHILIPELSLCYITSNKYHKYDFHYTRRIHMTRFTDNEKIKTKRANINFNNKAKLELLEYVVETMKKIKALHDKLESFYINAVDFNKIENLYEKLKVSIL